MNEADIQDKEREFIPLLEAAERIAVREGVDIYDAVQRIADQRRDEPNPAGPPIEFGWRHLTLFRREEPRVSAFGWDILDSKETAAFWAIADKTSQGRTEWERHKDSMDVIEDTYADACQLNAVLDAYGYLIEPSEADPAKDAWFDLFGLMQRHQRRANEAEKRALAAESEARRAAAASREYYEETKCLKEELAELRKAAELLKDAAVDAKFYKDQREVVIRDLHAARDENARLVSERDAAVKSEASSRHTSMVLQQQIDLMTKKGAQPKQPATQMTNAEAAFIALLARVATDTPIARKRIADSTNQLIGWISDNYPGDDIPIPIPKTVKRYLEIGLEQLSEKNASNREFIDWLIG